MEPPILCVSTSDGVAGAREKPAFGTVRDLARTSARVEFEDRGKHEPNGIGEPQRLFVVRERA